MSETMPTTELITVDELYQLRGLLSKLDNEPNVREFVKDAVTVTYGLTSVLLDKRRPAVAQ